MLPMNTVLAVLVATHALAFAAGYGARSLKSWRRRRRFA
jgi:hypothetical protein